MMDVSMLIQNAKEGCGLDEKELLRQLQKQRAGALETAIAQYGAYVARCHPQSQPRRPDAGGP